MKIYIHIIFTFSRCLFDAINILNYFVHQIISFEIVNIIMLIPFFDSLISQ